MEYVKIKNINVGDIVECLTSDGWESGEVTKVTTDIITVFMNYIDEEKEFEINEVR
jgi:hypothetical protein